MRLFLLSLALVVATPAAAQDWRMAPEYDVQLSTYDIQPPDIRLRAGEPVRLRFVNNSNQRLTFSAGGFFRSARMRRRDSGLVRGGSVSVPPLSTRTVVLVPRPGRYRVQGANLLHRVLGMSARIIVE
ncbi:MAG TPA: cupredoxin domain-containing protein [Allosphingosinicella sp.]|jgi:plastocyanin